MMFPFTSFSLSLKEEKQQSKIGMLALLLEIHTTLGMFCKDQDLSRLQEGAGASALSLLTSAKQASDKMLHGAPLQPSLALDTGHPSHHHIIPLVKRDLKMLARAKCQQRVSDKMVCGAPQRPSLALDTAHPSHHHIIPLLRRDLKMLASVKCQQPANSPCNASCNVMRCSKFGIPSKGYKNMLSPLVCSDKGLRRVSSSIQTLLKL